MPRASTELGRAAEEYARRYLERAGLELIERNYRCRGGEIDLVMRDGGSLVFVEVRMRNDHRFGDAVESVDRRKQQRLVVAARHYLAYHRLGDRPCRFDLVALRLQGDDYQTQWLRHIIETT